MEVKDLPLPKELFQEYRKPEFIHLGTFQVDSGLIVSDPKNDKRKKGSYSSTRARKGTWNAYVLRGSVWSWENRNCELIVCHSDYDIYASVSNFKEVNSVISDSGQLGIFDIDLYRNVSAVKNRPREVWTKEYDYSKLSSTLSSIDPEAEVQTMEEMESSVEEISSVSDRTDPENFQQTKKKVPKEITWDQLCDFICNNSKDTSFNPRGAGVIDFGAMSSTGKGKGEFELYSLESRGYLNAIKVIFIPMVVPEEEIDEDEIDEEE